MPYSSNLDALRAIAVTLVVVSHIILLQTGGHDLPVYSFHAMGHVGVAIFFVHTTLVLMMSLERHGPDYVPFLIRRAFRIFPLSVAVVLFIALAKLVFHSPFDMEQLLSNLFLVQNLTGAQPAIGPLWSLSYEIAMYAWLPLLYLMVVRTKRSVLWSAVLCAALIALASSDATNLAAFHSPGTNPSLLRFAPCFLSGLLAFTLTKRLQASISPRLLFALVIALGVVGVPTLAAVGLPETPILWITCLALGIAIPSCREISSERLTKGSQMIAKYSYGAYLSHTFALGAIDGLMPGPAIVQWVAMLILLPGLAYICYHCIEKHGIALGARIADRLSHRVPRSSVVGVKDIVGGVYD